MKMFTKLTLLAFLSLVIMVPNKTHTGCLDSINIITTATLAGAAIGTSIFFVPGVFIAPFIAKGAAILFPKFFLVSLKSGGIAGGLIGAFLGSDEACYRARINTMIK